MFDTLKIQRPRPLFRVYLLCYHQHHRLHFVRVGVIFPIKSKCAVTLSWDNMGCTTPRIMRLDTYRPTDSCQCPSGLEVSRINFSSKKASSLVTVLIARSVACIFYLFICIKAPLKSYSTLRASISLMSSLPNVLQHGKALLVCKALTQSRECRSSIQVRRQNQLSRHKVCEARPSHIPLSSCLHTHYTAPGIVL